MKVQGKMNKKYLKICTFENKRCFDEIKANLILALAKVSKNHKRQEKRKYYCKHCRYWHLTKNK